jgi:Tol biopolymer transport system component/TolB-like protein/tetratricopeptide (TPR) repeat protein
MGEVYRARDERLDREVAVKVLPRDARLDADRLRRFEREARAAGTLNHPNLLVVYDVGNEGEISYVVSELLEGSTLGDRLARGPLPLRECLDYAAQVAAGLAAAHDKGIVHRDLKPQNLFLTRDGRVKLLDFGLAKRTATLTGAESEAPTVSGATQPGAVLGTMGYISPEQLTGRPADARSDVFAAGAVLYEMLAGRPAFRRASEAETISAILREEPPPLASLRNDVPPRLEAIVRRCLRKLPEERHATARELAAEIAALGPAPPPEARPPHRRVLAVLPFRDLSEQTDGGQLGLGLADATITELARLRSLQVRPTSAILRYRDGVAEPQRVAAELAADVVLDASFQRSGGRLRVTLQLVDAHDGRPFWATKIDAPSSDLFEMQDEVARRIAEALEPTLTPADRRWIAGPRPGGPDADAYERYLRGRVLLFGERLADFVQAVDWFEQARTLEPGFALAWAGLADAYSRIAFTYQPEGDWYARAVAACDKALELEPSLPEGCYVRARLRWTPQAGFDHAGAARDLVLALRARPGLEEAWVLLGNVLHHVGLIDEARGVFERAEAASPGHPRARAHVVMCLLSLGRYQEAQEQVRRLAGSASYSFLDYLSVLCLLHLGRLEEAERAVARHSEREPVDVLTTPLLALAAAARGDAGAAERLLAAAERSIPSYGHYHHALYDVACVHALLGRSDQALRRLAQAVRGGYPCVPQLERDEFLASLRGLPGFQALLAEAAAHAARCAPIYAELRAETPASPALAPAGRPPARDTPSAGALEDGAAARDRDRLGESGHGEQPPPASARDALGPAPSTSSRRRPPAAAMLAGALLLAALAAVVWSRRERARAGLPTPRLAQLTFSEGVEEFPAWSPDGRTLAFSADRGPVRKLVLKRLDSGEELQLTGGEADDLMPAWSPDGRTLAFVRAQQTGRKLQPSDPFGTYDGGDLWAIDVETRRESRLAEGAYDPAWSPDGQRLAVDASWAGPRRLWLLDAQGRNPQQVTTDASEAVDHLRPRWSPDGARLVFKNVERTKFDVRVVDVASKRLGWVTDDALQDVDPAWSPGGRFIFFSSYRSGGLNLWRVPVSRDGRPEGPPQQLTTGAGQDVQVAFAADGRRAAFTILGQNADLWRLPVSRADARPQGPPQPVVATTREDSRGAWSPDGLSVAFNSDRAGHMNIWIHSLREGSSRPLTQGPGGDFQPNWAPDGSRIAFFSNRSGNADVWTVDVRSGALVQLTRGPAVDANPFFSPDGEWIAYHSDSGGHMEAWVMKADGGAARPLTRMGVSGHFLRWTPDGRAVVFRSSAPGRVQVFKVALAGGEHEPLAEVAGGAHISFSPDRSAILDVVGHRALWVSPLEAGSPAKVFEFGDPSVRIDYPVWSPDGLSVLFDRYRPQGGDVWLVEGLDE